MKLDCLFVYTNLGPHMVSWINASARHQRCGVIELAGSQAIYNWDASCLDPSVFHAVLDSKSELESLDADRALRKATDLIHGLRPLAVLTCRYDLGIIRDITRAARRAGSVTLLMSDSWGGVKARNPVREMIKGALLQRLYDGGIVAGVRSWEYLLKLGFRAKTLWTGIDVVDNAHFRSQDAEYGAPRVCLRSIPDLPKNYFLVPCRHAPEKNLARFLHAFAAYRRAGGSWAAVLVGSGPLSPMLMSIAKRLAMEDATVFAGWVSYADLPAYYGRSGAVVLPSVSEPWGLVVNEAMAAGKPVLVSARCGCVPELVRRGVNGYTFDPFDVNELSSLLLRMSSGGCDLDSLGRNGASMIQAFTLETRALAIRDCVETLVEAPRRHRLSA